MTPHLQHAIGIFLYLIIVGGVVLSPMALAFYLGEKGYNKTAIAVFTIWIFTIMFFDVYSLTS